MNLTPLKHQVSRHITNIPGWRTNCKILVIESDDWGNIRMPSKEVYEKLLKAGLWVDRCPYNKYDSLASEEDLSALFGVLTKFQDKNGNHPIITANSLVANPDFEKIKNSGFKEYLFEPFTKTLERYPKHSESFLLWQEGIEKKLFYPQFHGREHLNVRRWMKQLRSGSKETMLAFKNELFGISTTITTEKRKSYLAALDWDDESDLAHHKELLSEGLDLFEDLFKYKSASYIATNYTWHPEIELTLAEKGVRFIQGAGTQSKPGLNGNTLIRHRLGQKNSFGQTYLTRNCGFEPSLNEKKDWVSSCLKEIEIAFFWKKPAVISSHRLNYIGFIDESNRSRNLKHLESLLKTIVKKWPEVEFLTSEQLGEVIIRKELK